jgi:hypothetical protein
VVLQEAEKYAAKVDVDNSGMALIFSVYAQFVKVLWSYS